MNERVQGPPPFGVGVTGELMDAYGRPVLLRAGVTHETSSERSPIGLRRIGQTRHEGIETEAEPDTVHCLGIHCGQGYLLGRPRPVSVVMESQAQLSAS